MIFLQVGAAGDLGDAQRMLRTAIGVELGTLPPYLYALYSIRPGTNAPAVARIKSVALQEMIHLCLACNILNALGGDPVLQPQTYPGPLPGDIGPPGGDPLTIRLLPFSADAMDQAMKIEQPENPPDFPVRTLFAVEAQPQAVTIGQFYAALDELVKGLPAGDWQQNRNQIVGDQFFAGQVFAINGYADAHNAIQQIVSEGEGAKDDPLDFQHEPAHYYRFGEIYHDKVLTKDTNPLGYAWGPQPLGVDWSAVYPAISDPGSHDFSHDPPAAQHAQEGCDAAFAALINELNGAVSGQSGALGQAVRAMFDLRTAALHAFTTPLAGGTQVAGPAFRYKSPQTGVTP